MSATTLLLSAVPVQGQNPPDPPARPEDTEVWEPVPPSVSPPEAFSAGAEAPGDAIVLFDGDGLGEWVQVRGGRPAAWPVADGVVTTDRALGSIQTRPRFGDYQLHLEWRIPRDARGSGQGRGNSGVFLASTGGELDGYEIQILDSYDNDTYVNGMAGSVYKQGVPLANPSRPRGEWQTFDIVWRAPTFEDDGALRTPARVTVLFNGVLVQNGFVLSGQTLYVGAPFYRRHGDSPIKLQAHPDSGPVDFRNIWVRPLP